MGKKLSRREFAKSSVAAGAAAMALPTTLFGNAATAAPATSPAAAAGAAAAATASTAATLPRKRVTMPIEVEYGGRMSWGRDLTLEETLTPAGEAAPDYPKAW